jgi:hypothetical protein
MLLLDFLCFWTLNVRDVNGITRPRTFAFYIDFVGGLSARDLGDYTNQVSVVDANNISVCKEHFYLPPQTPCLLLS